MEVKTSLANYIEAWTLLSSFWLGAGTQRVGKKHTEKIVLVTTPVELQVRRGWIPQWGLKRGLEQPQGVHSPRLPEQPDV